MLPIFLAILPFIPAGEVFAELTPQAAFREGIPRLIAFYRFIPLHFSVSVGAG